MSFEYLIDPANGPQWKGQLPGKPAPYVLRKRRGRARDALHRPLHRAALR